MARFALIRAMLIIWLVVVIAVSISPLSFKLKLHTIGAYHDFGHYVVYALTGILLWLATDRWPFKLLAFLAGSTLAFAQEWIENRIYHAGFEWKDVGTDLAGLISGFALMLLITVLTTDERERQGL